MKSIAIVLAAGSGKRMQSATKKQFMLVHEKPVLYYSLKAFEDSFVDNVIIVASKDDEAYIREDIINKYKFTKVISIVEGGPERYHSVLFGLRETERIFATDDAYVFVHDGARPMIDQDILGRALEAVKEFDACVVGMPSKDTVKIANENGMVVSTPKRDLVWTIQTPQVFRFNLIKEAYEDVISREEELKAQGISVTDDAMVLEISSNHPIKLVEGSYQNIKVTTPDDLPVLEDFLKKFGQ